MFQVFHCFRCARYFGADSERFTRYYFGVAELMLILVGVVDVVVGGGHVGSWMIFVSLYLSFCEAEKGL